VTDAAGNVTKVNQYSTDITRITLTFTQTKDIIGDFKLTGSMSSNGNTLTSATLDAPRLTPGTATSPSCVTGVSTQASVFPETFTLKVCAAALPRDPTTQEIFIEYSSKLPVGTKVNSPDPSGLFGDDAIFSVNLDWTLAGSTISDHADAVLKFTILTTNQGTNSWYKLQDGLVTVIRNGGA
jgi:hypothetical protein